MKKGDSILVFDLVYDLENRFDRVEGPARSRLLEVRVVRVKGNKLWWRSSRYQSAHPGAQVLSFDDRGVTWAPAWRESERRAFETAVALRGKP